MCGEDYFYRDWPSPPPSGDGEKKPRSKFAEWPGPYAYADDVDADGPEGWEEDDLPDFGDPEADEDEWEEEGWFGADEEGEWTLQLLEDAIMLMDEDALLEWLTMDEEWQPYRSSCGETALLDWEEAA